MSNRKPKTSLAGILLRILIFLAAASMFGYGAYQMYGYLSENAVSDQARDQLAQQSVTILIPPEEQQNSSDGAVGLPSPGISSSEKDAPDLSQSIPILVDFETLQQENPNIIGWIYCADTPISYPIVQGEDNQYYVNHLVDGTPLGSGAIFLDFRNSPDFSDLNSLVYGHNMTNKSMFGSLRYYRNQSYYDEHPVLWIATPELAYRVDLIAGCITAADSDDYTLFETDEELQQHLSEVMEASTFKSNVNPSQVSRIVTLSTCTYEYDNARLIVIGSLLPIPYPDTESNDSLLD